MKNRYKAVTVALGLLLAVTFRPTQASQSTSCMPTTGTVSGLTVSQNINNALAAFLSMFSGGTPPVVDCSAVLIKGQRWLDTTTNTVKEYDGANWLPIGSYDTTNHIWKPAVGGGVETLTAAATTDLCSVAGSLVTIISSTTITGFGSSCPPGIYKILSFSGTPILTNSASLLLPSRANIATVSGDTAMAMYLGSGNWQIATYNPANGQSVSNVAVEVGTIQSSIAASLPANNKYVFGFGQALTRINFPDYVTATTRAQSAIRISGNATLTGVSDTSGMGTGMPVEGTGIQVGSTIVSVTPSTIVLSLTASTSGTSTATVFFTGYGAGGSSTTIGVPDCRNAVLAGRGDMGGTDRGLLNSTYFGAAGTSLNAFGGAQSLTILANNIAAHNHPVFLNDPGHFHTGGGVAPSGAFWGSGSFVNLVSASVNTDTKATGITVRDTTGGGGTANQTANNSTTTTPIRTVQPTLIVQCIVRVLVLNDVPLDIPANDNAHVAISRRFA